MSKKRVRSESGGRTQDERSWSPPRRAAADAGGEGAARKVSDPPAAAVVEGVGDDGRRPPSVPARPVWIAFTSLLSLVMGILGTRLALWYVEFIRPFVVQEAGSPIDPGLYWFSLIAFTIVGLLLGSLLASLIFRQLMVAVPRLESMPLEDKIAGFVGLFLGLGLAFLLQPLLNRIPYVGALLVWTIYLLLGFLGPFVTLTMKREIVAMLRVPSIASMREEGEWEQASRVKLLDTNVIIDGRIADIWRTGFLEGSVLLPEFILRELHQIADSDDDLRRARGRRGLDMLREMQEDPIIDLHVLRDYGIKFARGEPVDMRLIKLARHLKALIVTNDYNLNKLARVEEVQVLNVNALANALKPVVLPGEEMSIHVVREGKEAGQGVGYLDDGTMVVVEEGLPYVGGDVEIIVSSVLQTAAGKMIFGTPKSG